ncbi:hypothetical protein [Hydrotalea flava]|uniref:hypothetical protein n=1 Tax=Hydrotalea flava TaxID=714549 RepID=UPI00142EC18A|nr:hypothetical protein [Hydrotalea flava]
MYTVIFTLAALLLVIFIGIQLVRLYTYIISLSKDAALLQVHIKEEKEYQFIKGLY